MVPIESAVVPAGICCKANEQEIIGESAPLQHALQLADVVAPTDATVLVLGESGTGKELIAKRVHNLSERRHHPFVEVSCAAIPSWAAGK